jgi:hypothetical protein
LAAYRFLKLKPNTLQNQKMAFRVLSFVTKGRKRWIKKGLVQERADLDLIWDIDQ